MQIKHEDMLKMKELMELVTALKDYVNEDRQIFIMITMNSRGMVNYIEFNKDCSWAAPFSDLAIPLTFIPLQMFEDFSFEVIYHIEDNKC